MPKFEGDLLVNGTSLLDYGCIVDFSPIFQEAPLRGGNLKIPGLQGEVYVRKVRDAYDFSVLMTLKTEFSAGVPTHSETLATVYALRTLLESREAPLQLTRVRPLVDGTFVNEGCLGEYTSGLEPELVGFRHGRLALTLRNLSGSWT